MAKKAANKKGLQDVVIAPGKGTGRARYGHGSVVASIETLNRAPLAIPVAKAKADPKGEFLLNLLQEAGKDGITWAQMQEQLRTKFGAAPKKRHSLYAVLQGKVWHKTTGQKGQVTYFLGKAPKVRSRKQA